MSDPGLNVAALQALRRPRPGAVELTTRIREHLDTHDGYVAFSGGKDSLAALHLALRVEPNVPVVFFDSGLEFPENYLYSSRCATGCTCSCTGSQPAAPLSRSSLTAASGITTPTSRRESPTCSARQKSQQPVGDRLSGWFRQRMRRRTDGRPGSRERGNGWITAGRLKPGGLRLRLPPRHRRSSARLL